MIIIFIPDGLFILDGLFIRDGLEALFLSLDDIRDVIVVRR